MQTRPQFIMTPGGATIIHEGRHLFVSNQHPGWIKIQALIAEDRIEDVIPMVDVSHGMEDYYNGQIKVVDGVVLYKDKQVDNYPATRAVEFMRAGLPYQPLLAFIQRLENNPSDRARSDLYQFLEYGKLPLTPDGCFLAYKKVHRMVSGHLVDIYTRKIQNNPGDTPTMPRDRVNDDPHQTCSAGLHVCSYEYLDKFGTGPASAVILVKVSPADVVAVPMDYNNTKMRCCKYQVLKVIKDLDLEKPKLTGHDGILFIDDEEDEEDEG